MIKTIYVVEIAGRGNCNHAHRSFAAARRCLAHQRREQARTYGYRGCSLWRISGGTGLREIGTAERINI